MQALIFPFIPGPPVCVDQLFSHSVNVEAASSNHTESYTIRRREETTSKTSQIEIHRSKTRFDEKKLPLRW